AEEAAQHDASNSSLNARERRGDEILVVVLDDDRAVAKELALRLGNEQVFVESYTQVKETLVRLKELKRASAPPALLVVDLILPRTDGRGILGGLEVVEMARVELPDTKMLLFSDYDNRQAKER